MLDIIISIQRIDTTKESTPVIMEFDGLVDITQRFATLVKSAITDKKDLFLVPTDYYKRETDAVAYIVGSDHSVYKVSIFEKIHISSIAYRKVRIKDLVSEAQFSEYIYRLSYALTHSFFPSAFSTVPKKKCNCGNDHCDCHKEEQKSKYNSVRYSTPITPIDSNDIPKCDSETPHFPLDMETRTMAGPDGTPIDMFSEQDKTESAECDHKPSTSSGDTTKQTATVAITEEDAESDSKFRPRYRSLRK